MKAIVIGSTGTIGSAVKKRLEKEGYEVIGASRNSGVRVDIEDDVTVKNLLEQTGKVDVIISAAGSAAFGEMKNLSEKDFSLSLNNKLMGQVKLLQKGLPYLNAGGVILLTGGIYAYKPVQGSAAIAMVNLALEGFVRAATLEIRKDHKIIVVHPPLVAETAEDMGLDPAPFLTAEEVADTYLDAINEGRSGVPFFAKNNAP